MTFPIFLIFLLIYISKAEEDQNIMNVGTVLFTDSDNSKDCWGTENIALLTSRMMLEDVLPSRDVLIIKDSAFITDLIDYFRLVLEVVRKVTYGKTKHIMLLALTDTLGGYLNHFVIPIAKHAYYAGYIDYDSMDRLYQLFDELKCFLRTNGHGWAKPVTEFSKKMDPEPIPIQSPAPKTDPCQGLIIYDKPSKHEGGQHISCPIGIPMPFFDSKTRPTSIAIPFKTYSLRNLESKSASYVLVKFYMAATKCLAMRNADQSSMNEFNANIYSWIRTQVIPHLNDDKFFSAFGGVLRIEDTLGKMGTKQISNKEMGNYNIMPEQQVKEFSKEGFNEASGKKRNFILVALLVTIFIWFLLGSLFICYRIKAAKNRKGECLCDKGVPKSSTTTGSSKPSSKMSKISTKLFSSSGSSKKPSNTSTGTTGQSKKTTMSSGRASPGGISYRSSASEASVISDRSLGSGIASPAPSGGSKRTRSTVPSPKSNSSRSSRRLGGGGVSPGDSPDSRGSKNSKKTATPSKKSTKSGCGIRSGLRSLRDVAKREKPLYPASCACHTSMTGKYRMTSSSEEQMRRKEKEEPLVFGYELETSSDSSERDPNEELIDYGEMPK